MFTSFLAHFKSPGTYCFFPFGGKVPHLPLETPCDEAQENIDVPSNPEYGNHSLQLFQYETLGDILHDAHNKITHNVVYDFLGKDWYLEWKHITVAFVGQTYDSEEMLTKEGEIYINGIILTNHKRQKL